MTNILVCGGRGYYKYSKVWQALGNLITDIWFKDETTPIHIMSGDQPGAEFIAKVFAMDEYDQVPLITYQGYTTPTPALGGISARNQRMLDEGKPDIVLAFAGSVATTDMIAKATAAGVEVIQVA